MSRAKKFWEVADKIVCSKFHSICRDDEDIVREAMERFAEICSPEGEHAEIAELSAEALCDLVTKVSFEHPETFVAYLEILSEAVAVFLSQEAAEQQRSS